MLQFRLLGYFQMRADDRPVAIPSRLGQSLLSYLLLTRAFPQRREKLAGLFWPDTSENKARGNLRHELWRLRKALDACPTPCSDLLLSDDLTVRIDPQASYSLDVAVLEASPNASSTYDLVAALDVYQGELLPDFYDEWITLERQRLHALFEQQMERLLEQLGAEARWKEILEWAERWIAMAQSPEAAYRALMRAHSALGNRAQVAEVYERCRTVLQADLSVEPSEQTLSLYQRLTTGEIEGRGAEGQPNRGAVNGEYGQAPLSPERSPYKGLRYFDESDAAWFFGRERVVATLAERLAEHHWLTVVGASGSGKSSLLRAGLIPALRTQLPSGPADTNGERWTIHVLTPTAHPLEALAVELTRGIESATAATTLADDLAGDPRSLRIHCQKTRAPVERLLLVIDQFEELFTLCRDERERQSYIENLMLATAPELDRPLSVVVALRADFYPQASQYANLRETLSQRQECVGPMTMEEMRRAIEAPAQRGGWQLEHGLVELMLQDVGTEPGALPLLSHALLETWNRRQERKLTLAGYASCGGVRGAIAQTAENVYKKFTSDQQAIARQVFLQLAELGEGTPDTRRRVRLVDLASLSSNAEEVRGVLYTLADARLVTLSEDSAEVAHEALIREWPALREWLNQDREALRLHRQLTAAAQAWDKMQRDSGELYRGLRLAQTLEWAKSWIAELNPLEQEFLGASRARQVQEEAEREAQRRRELVGAQKLAESEKRRADILRAATTGATVLLVLMIGLALFAFSQRTAADSARVEAVMQRDAAESERRIALARELSVNAVNSLEVDAERSVLLALQAVSVSTANGQPVLREAEEALHRAVQASRVQLTLRGHSGVLLGLAYSPDGKRLATAGADRTAKVWDTTTGKELSTLRGHTDTLSCVVFSPDGKRIATASYDKTAKVWDAETGEELLTFRGHTDVVSKIAFSPVGARLATASYDKTAKVWDVLTGRELVTLRGHDGGVAAIAYSPDGTRLATGGYSDELERTVRVWDANTGQDLLILKGHVFSLTEVTFSPDGKRIASGSYDKTARIWDSRSGQLLLTVFIYSNAYSVAFSPDGTRLATGGGDGLAKVWDATTGELVETLAGQAGAVNRVAFNPDGTRLATASADGTAKVWDITPAGAREWLTVAYPDSLIMSLALSPDGARVAAAGSDGTTRLFDSQTGREVVKLYAHSGNVGGAAFSPDGKRLATAGRSDDTVKVWDTTTGKQLLTLSNPSEHSTNGPRVAYSPDGRLIASVGKGETAQVWDATTGAEVLTLCCHTAAVRGVAFSPDGTRLATSGRDKTVRIWDISTLLNTGLAGQIKTSNQTGKELLTLSGHTGAIWAVTYSPDGKRIATAGNDGTAKVWDAATGKELLTLSGHSGGLNDVAFSPDGRVLATASGDATVKVWDISTPGAQSQQPLTLYSPQGGNAKNVAFSPDGKRLTAAMPGGNFWIYAIPSQDIIELAKSRLTRSWTTDECQKFLHMDACPAD